MTNRKYVVVLVAIFLSMLVLLCGCTNKQNAANTVADKFEMIELNNSADSAVTGSPLWKENFTSPYTDDDVDTCLLLISKMLPIKVNIGILWLKTIIPISRIFIK